MSEYPICYKCNKPLYPIDLINKDEKSWCDCDKIGVSDGWSGWIDKKPQKYRGRR